MSPWLICIIAGPIENMLHVVERDVDRYLYSERVRTPGEALEA